jgi:hypothetical protein
MSYLCCTPNRYSDTASEPTHIHGSSGTACGVYSDRVGSMRPVRDSPLVSGRKLAVPLEITLMLRNYTQQYEKADSKTTTVVRPSHRPKRASVYVTGGRTSSTDYGTFEEKAPP